MKGQANIMEYMILAFFAVILIVVIVIMMVGWQITSIGQQAGNRQYDKALFLLESFTNSPLLNRASFSEGSMLEDSRLSVLTCDDLQSMWGEGWYADIRLLGFEGDCTQTTYPSCGHWEYCRQEKNAVAFEIPINIYRKSTSQVDVGILTVGVYV